MKSSLTILAVSLLAASPLLAQQKRVSPPDITSTVIDGGRVMVVYSRPYSKDPKSGETRKIWGGLVPFGKVWRTGANEATLLVTQQPIAFGETTVPAGTYTLFTLPAEDGSAKLIVSKQVGEWGEEYDKSQDLAQIDLKKEATDKPVEQFTMQVAKGGNGGGTLKMMWENVQYSADFTAKK